MSSIVSIGILILCFYMGYKSEKTSVKVLSGLVIILTVVEFFLKGKI